MPIATASMLEAAQSRYDIGDILGANRLEGGEWKTLYRLDTARGPFVLSLCHPSATIESIAWEHAFLRYLAAQLPQAPAPIEAHDGKTFFVHAGRIASLLPFMPGRIVDAADIRPQAAQLLAQYHHAAMAYPNHTSRSGIPALREWRWDSNHAWRWPEVEALLNSTPHTAPRFWRDGGAYTQEIVAQRAQISNERLRTERWVAQLTATKRPLAFGIIHDDYYKRNLLVEGGQITALLDWDGCHPDWLMMDLSNAVWSFCDHEAEHTLDADAGRAFVAAYLDADGPISHHELYLLVPFIRFRWVLETLSGLQNMLNGEQWDEGCAEYALHTLLSLENLQKIAAERFD